MLFLQLTVKITYKIMYIVIKKKKKSLNTNNVLSVAQISITI